MRLRRAGVTFWIATMTVQVALTTHAAHSGKAAAISRCQDKVALVIMKQCSIALRHKRDVGERVLPERFLPGTPDPSVETFVPDTNKAYARRQLQRRDSDVAMPTSEKEWDLYSEGGERLHRFLNPGSSYRVRRRYPYVSFDIENPSRFEPLLPLFPLDDPELNPLNEEDLEDVYNDLLYERTPRESTEKPINFPTEDVAKCCQDKMCLKKFYFNMCSRS